MMTVYVDWENQEVLTEKQLNERRKELLNLTGELGKCNFVGFYEEVKNYDIIDITEILIDLLTVDDNQETIDFLRKRYKKYVDNQLDNIYEKIILD